MKDVIDVSRHEEGKFSKSGESFFIPWLPRRILASHAPNHLTIFFSSSKKRDKKSTSVFFSFFNLNITECLSNVQNQRNS